MLQGMVKLELATQEKNLYFETVFEMGFFLACFCWCLPANSIKTRR